MMTAMSCHAEPTSPYNHLQQSYPPTSAKVPNTDHRFIYCALRLDGYFVPLIPMDELPPNVHIKGVPRTLSPEETLCLKQAGALPLLENEFEVKMDATDLHSNQHIGTKTTPSNGSTKSPRVRIPDASLHQASTSPIVQVAASTPVPAPPASQFSAPTLAPAPATSRSPAQASSPSFAIPLSKPIRSVQAVKDVRTETKPNNLINAIAATNPGAEAAERFKLPTESQAVPPSGNKPNQDAKIYCTHWIRTGECDYTQQGCLYKHEMPPNREELKKVGLTDIPAFRKAQGFRFEQQNIVHRPVAQGTVATTNNVAMQKWLRKQRQQPVTKDETEEGVCSEPESDDTPPKNQYRAPDRPKVAVQKPVQSTSSAGIGSSLDAYKPLQPTIPPKTASTPNVPKKGAEKSMTNDLLDFKPLVPTSSSGKATPVLMDLHNYSIQGNKPASQSQHNKLSLLDIDNGPATAEMTTNPGDTARQSGSTTNGSKAEAKPIAESASSRNVESKDNGNAKKTAGMAFLEQMPTHLREGLKDEVLQYLTRAGEGMEHSKYAQTEKEAQNSSRDGSSGSDEKEVPNKKSQSKGRNKQGHPRKQPDFTRPRRPPPSNGKTNGKGKGNKAA